MANISFTALKSTAITVCLKKHKNMYLFFDELIMINTYKMTQLVLELYHQ